MANNGRVGIHYEPNTARYDTSDQTTVQYAYFCVDGVMLAKLRDFGLQTKQSCSKRFIRELLYQICVALPILYISQVRTRRT